MTKEIVAKAQERMAHSHQSLAREFGNIRAGRANASLFRPYFSRILWRSDAPQSAGRDYHSRSTCSLDYSL